MQGTEIVQAIAGTPWLEIIKAMAPAATAAIAYSALRNWRKQDRAKRESEFLDQIIDATHTYIVEMKRPVSLLHFAKIGMASHVREWSEGDQHAKDVTGAIAYIEKNGERDGKLLAEALRAVEPSVTKLQSLLAKGQVFRFEGYSKLQNAITMLTWHYGRIASFHSIISTSTWYWENPEIKSLLEKVMKIEPDEINADIGVQSVAVIEFARETYERIYG